MRVCITNLTWRYADAGDETAPNLVNMDGSVLDEAPDGGDTDMMGDADDDYDEVEALAEEHQLRAERRQQEAADDVDFPDEIETPHDVPARVCTPLIATFSFAAVWLCCSIGRK